VVHIDQEGLFQPPGRYVFKLCLIDDVVAHEYGLPYYYCVDVQGVYARQIMYLAILSLLSKNIGHLHHIAGMV
jgi:hypothetical protein